MPYVKQTWVDDVSPLSAARFNHMEAGIEGSEAHLSWPLARLRQTTTQTGMAAGWRIINLQGEEIDTHDGHSTVTNISRWTCPAGQAGIYAVEGGVVFGALASGQAYNSAIFKNGAGIAASYSNWQHAMGAVGGGASGTGRHFVTLAVGDYVELGAYSSLAFSTNIFADGACWLQIERIR